MTNEQQTISAYFSKLGKRSSEKLTPEERSERAKKAVAKRWEEYRKNKAT